MKNTPQFLENLGLRCETYLKDKMSLNFIGNLYSFEKTDIDIISFVSKTNKGEGSLFDSVSYSGSLRYFTGDQIVQIHALGDHFIYRYMTKENLIELFDCKEIPTEFKRVLFMHLYFEYCCHFTKEYLNLKKSIKKLLE